MDLVYKGYNYFRREIYPGKRRYYRKLEQGQNPKLMFMLCSDSRKCLSELFGLGPNDCFCGRNPGNVVPPFMSTLGGDQAAIEYGVQVLKVDHLVIMGHSGCGAMQALHNGVDKIRDKLPATANMLTLSGTDPAQVQTSCNPLRALTQLHVKTQLRNALTYPFVREAVEEGRLKLHGLVYQIGNGLVLRYDPDSDRFEELPGGEPITPDSTCVGGHRSRRKQSRK